MEAYHVHGLLRVFYTYIFVWTCGSRLFISVISFYVQSIYWLGPFIGGAVAAIVYKIVILINKRSEKLKAMELAANQQLPLNAHDMTNF
jgi:hypothetical protein